MLLRYFMRTKERAAVVRDVFREYMQSCHENTEITELRMLEGSPDQKPLVHNCFRLQYLLMERQKTRFEWLITTNSLDCAVFKSLGDIERRLDQEWTAADEAAINACDAHYCDVCRQIEAIQSQWVPDSLTTPLRKLTEDDIYRADSQDHAKRIRELEKRIKR